MGPSGEVVPVTVGNDSLSDSSTEVRQIRSKMRLLTDSSENFESDGYCLSDINNDASVESESGSGMSNNEQDRYEHRLLFADDARYSNAQVVLDANEQVAENLKHGIICGGDEHFNEDKRGEISKTNEGDEYMTERKYCGADELWC